MANSVILKVPHLGSDDYLDYQLVYNASTQERFAALYGAEISTQLPEIVQHAPVDGESLPTRARDADRVAGFEIILMPPAGTLDGAKWDAVVDAATEVKRIIQGATSEAIRHYIDGDVKQVLLRIQLDGQTNYTDIPVKTGYLDVTRVIFDELSDASKRVWKAPLVLLVPPYGFGKEFQIYNLLSGSPGMLDFDSGVAWGLSAYGTPTLSQETTRALYGGSSQKVVTDNSTSEGVITDTITATAPVNCIFNCWVSATSASCDPILIEVIDGTGTQVEDKEFDPASPSDYDRTMTDAAGNTWYLYRIEGFNLNNNFQCRVYRPSTSATKNSTFYVDLFYFATFSTAQPNYAPAWGDVATLTNRNDYDSTNPEYKNHWSVWGIPGDYPAIIKQTVTITAESSTPATLIAGQMVDGRVLSVDQIHWQDSADMGTGSGSVTWSSPTDASRIGGSYRRAAGAGTGNFYIAIDQADLAKFLACPHVVYLIMRTDDAAGTYVQMDGGSFSSFDGGDVVYLTTDNTWEIHKMGLVVPKPNIPTDDIASGTYAVVNFSLGVAATKNFDVDAAFLLPVGHENILAANGSVTTNDVIHIRGDIKRYFITFAAGGLDDDHQGSLWYARPGRMATRYAYAWLGATDEHDLSVAWTVDATVIPRTTHLIGEL